MDDASADVLMKFLDSWPVHERVVPRHWMEMLRDGAKVPWLRSAVYWRHDHEVFDADGLVGLFKPSFIRPFRGVDFSEASLGDDRLKRILGRRRKLSIQHLDLRLNGLSSVSLEHILSASTLARQVQFLGLSSNPSMDGHEVCGRLARSRKLDKLCQLDLSGNGFDDDHIKHLIYSRQMSGLNALNLHGNALTDDGVTMLARSPYLGRLQSIDLSDQTECGDLSAKVLANSDVLRRTKHIFLANNNITSEGVLQFVRRDNLALKTLDLRHNLIDDRGARALMRNTVAEQVELAGNPLSPGLKRELLNADVLGPQTSTLWAASDA